MSRDEFVEDAPRKPARIPTVPPPPSDEPIHVETPLRTSQEKPGFFRGARISKRKVAS